MSGGRSSALPAALAAAGVLLAAGAWFLAGEGGRKPAVPGTAPPIPAPPVEPPGEGAVPADPPVPAPPPPAPDGESDFSFSSGPWNLPPLPPRAAPWARLRFLDDATGEPVPASARPAVVLVARTDRGTLRLPERLYAGRDGRAAVVSLYPPGARPGENLYFTKEEAEAHRYEVLAFGYAPLADLRRSDLEGERDLRLVPVPPAVRGVLEAGEGLGKGVLRCELVPGGEGPRLQESNFFNDGPAVRAPALPREFGPFEIPSLAPGPWTLVVRHQQAGGVQARATASFEAGAGTVDLGTLVVRAPATIRVRVIGADGTGLLDQGLRVRKAGEASAESPPAGEPDAEGWVEFRGLEPDADYEVLCSLEGLAETVHTPPGAGAPLVVELRSEIRGVRCRIRFTVLGEEPLKWGAIFDGPTLDETAWRKDGLLEQEMAPGEYAFGILAQVAGSEKMVRYFARFKVPDQPAWEGKVDLTDRP